MFHEYASQRKAELEALRQNVEKKVTRKRDRTEDIKDRWSSVQKRLTNLETVTTSICTPPVVERTFTRFSHIGEMLRAQLSGRRLRSVEATHLNITKKLVSFFMENDAWYGAWEQLCTMHLCDVEQKEDSVIAKDVIDHVIESCMEQNDNHRQFDSFVRHTMVSVIVRDNEKGNITSQSCVAKLFEYFWNCDFGDKLRRQKIAPSMTNASQLIKLYLLLLGLINSMIQFLDVALSSNRIMNSNRDSAITPQLIVHQKQQYRLWANSLWVSVEELFAALEFAKGIYKKSLRYVVE